ncbi:hypothetical protein [Flavobacterium subsaxonicum]|uniref:Uncharacterized protein n=1 Tax=Flavobacterium subsaxonicum WB 4.1-42 = DSM 21790 TaxID=1121898 RepID=A0A0A2MQ51_9FLAO|nr:hypothetical protein [Flavobacterium subsaxonicum]KGO93656.1 hypothetical protein Q766_06755 [Flavobacterium subsaxonicum WB 4.1-42 = DSM 21790]
MQYKYLYIDDVKDGNEIGVINALQKDGHLEVDFMQPMEWDLMFTKEIDGTPNVDYLPKNLEGYNGLILDLRLYDNANNKGYTATYRGSTVAQEIRTLVKEKEINHDIPIVLITANENVDTSLDETGKDLFDNIVKRSDVGNAYTTFRSKLISLAAGYIFFNNEQKSLEYIFSYDKVSNIDFRFIQYFNDIKDQPTHVISRFLTKNVFEKPSFLIDEYYLSARLGISMQSEDWINFKNNFLNDYKYKGVFSDFYDRWWMVEIENWWDENFKDCYLRSITSLDRAKLISELFALKLSPLEKTPRSTSNKFWTVCKVTKRAIDNVDGFIIANQDDNFPWQEKEYISRDEALRPTNKTLWKDVAIIDKEKLEKLKAVLEREEQREKR